MKNQLKPMNVQNDLKSGNKSITKSIVFFFTDNPFLVLTAIYAKVCKDKILKNIVIIISLQNFATLAVK